jgi:DegV family protein with EDD domain
MSRIALVTNSGAALPPDLVAQYNITLIPLQIHFLDGKYEEGREIGLNEFYERLLREEVVPSTSPPSVLRYVQLFQTLAADHDIILVLHMTADLSGTYRNAIAAANQLSGVRVISYDSGSVALGLGFQVLTAARLIERGANIDAVLAALQQQREQTLAVFSPATLRYMRNSRRIGPMVALFATWLNIKPVIVVREGKLELIEHTRSWSAALDRQIAEVVSFCEGGSPLELGVCHGHTPDEAAALAERVRAHFPKARIYISDIGAAVTVHTGPGAVGLMTDRSGSHALVSPHFGYQPGSASRGVRDRSHRGLAAVSQQLAPLPGLPSRRSAGAAGGCPGDAARRRRGDLGRGGRRLARGDDDLAARPGAGR